jgi:two-component system response regulator HydG
LRNLANEEYPTLESAQSHGILPLAEMEKRAIIQAIEQLHGDKLEAARRLGIGKTTLYRKLKEYGALS